MTQEFKFGDIVRHPEIKNNCVFINQLYDPKTKKKTWAEVLVDDECEEVIWLVTHEPLELVPHPDTMRLNWLMEEGIIPEDIYYNTQSEDDDGLPYAYFSKHDCRAAIDSAMRRNRK